MLLHRSMRRVMLASAVMFLAATAGAPTAAAAPAAAPVLKEVNGNGQGSIIRDLATTGAPLLAGFQYDFTNGDHPLRRLAAFPLPGQSGVELTLADKNGDDNFTYHAAHKLVDPAPLLQRTLHGNCAGTCSVFLAERPSADSVFVLTGFRFSFDIAEHPLDRIAVREAGRVLTTSFRDQNGDDPYTYDVSYAWVPRSRLGAVEDVSGRVQGSGTVTRTAQGEKVIRGFSLDNLAPSGDARDNNIRDVGVVANQSTIVMLYGDRNPGDSADWQYDVGYATLI